MTSTSSRSDVDDTQQMCGDCGGKKRKVQLLTFTGEWVCPNCSGIARGL